MRYTSILLLCSLNLLMAACATNGSYSSALMKKGYSKTFDTSVVGSNFSYRSGGLGNSSAIQYQVQAYCKSNCSSVKAVLSFYISSNGNAVYIHNHNLNIEAGGKTYSWNQNTLHKHLDIASGRITAVILSKPELKQIATSKKVTGVLAGVDFNWSYSNRKPLRMLIQKLEKG